MRTPISESDLERIEQAVQEAEGRTSGEIVPYIVDRSADYPAARWRAGATVSALSMIVVLVLMLVYKGWGLAWLFTSAGTGVVLLLAGLLGAALARYVPMVERLAAGSGAMALAVRDRSVRAFVDEEVFNTRERTGILIFISLFEHRVEVVGDSGINALVEPEDWAHVVEDILIGIRNGIMTDGIVKAIDRCGQLLEEKGVEIRDDDENELGDAVRFGSG